MDCVSQTLVSLRNTDKCEDPCQSFNPQTGGHFFIYTLSNSVTCSLIFGDYFIFYIPHIHGYGYGKGI